MDINNDDKIFTNTLPIITIPELLLNSSRITPVGNGNVNSNITDTNQPTSGQKWWAAVILGFIFALLSSPVAYQITSNLISPIDGLKLIYGPGPTLLGLTLHTILFILAVRIILW